MKNRRERHYGHHHLHLISCGCYRRRPLLGTLRKRDAFLKILGEVRGHARARPLVDPGAEDRQAIAGPAGARP